jgi:hypothetical protein
VPCTLTLVRNATIATALTLSIGASVPVGFKASVTTAPVLFLDGDDFDIEFSVGPCEGSAKVSVSIE